MIPLFDCLSPYVSVSKAATLTLKQDSQYIDYPRIITFYYLFV